MDATATRLLTAADVESLASWPDAVAALRAAYAGPLTAEMVPPRIMARDNGVWLRGLTAVSPSGRYVGAKLITVNTANIKASYVITLIDRATTALAAIIDGNHVTGLRTAATSAMFADLAAPDRPLVVGVLGSGFEAYNHLAALASVRKIDRATVFSPTPASRTSFANRAEVQIGVPVLAADNPTDVVRTADIVLCAARARNESPILRGVDLRPGTTVISIGSTLPEQREVDTDTIARADRIVADMVEEVVHDTGDFIAAHRAGIHTDGRVAALDDVVSGRIPARAADNEIVLYKSVGSALQDIVIAELMLDLAAAQSVGTVIPSPITPLDK